MEKNTKNDNFYLYWIDLTKVKRMLSFPFQLDTIGCSYIEKDSYTGEHIGGMEIALRMRGDEKYSVDVFDDCKIKNEYPHLMIQREGVHHEYVYNKPRETFFMIYNPKLEQAFDEFGVKKNDISWPITITPDIVALMDELKSYFPIYEQLGVADKIDVAAWNLFTKIFLQKPVFELPKQDDRIHSIIVELQRNFMHEIDFEELARNYGMSHRTFFRYWNKMIDQTPQAFLTNIRLMHAAGFLSRTNMTVNEVCRNAGFNDPAYFSNIFKKYYNMSPSEYRHSTRVATIEQI
jgi:AraC-like DNA-binding protein